VSFSYIEQVVNGSVKDVSSDGVSNVATARLMRLLRLLRIVRVLRVLRFFKDMRIMVMGILHCLKPLVWALLLLGLINYIFAIIMLHLVHEDIEQLQSLPHYTSFVRLMFTFFMCISGGVNWVDVADPMQRLHPMCAPLFVLYIVFSVFCVLNIVTGVFVERSSRMAQEDEEQMLIEEIEGRKKWMKEIEVLFTKADSDGSGELSFEEFSGTLSDIGAETAFACWHASTSLSLHVRGCKWLVSQICSKLYRTGGVASSRA